MCQTSLIQTSCLALLKAIDDLGKLYGGHVVATLSHALLWLSSISQFAWGFSSSALVEAARLLLTVFSPCRRLVFLLSEEKGGKETDTEAFSAPI